MLLKTWLNQAKMSTKEFSQEINVQPNLVNLWAARIITPSLLNALLIDEYSKGEIPFFELLSENHIKKWKDIKRVK